MWTNPEFPHLWIFWSSFLLLAQENWFPFLLWANQSFINPEYVLREGEISFPVFWNKTRKTILLFLSSALEVEGTCNVLITVFSDPRLYFWLASFSIYVSHSISSSLYLLNYIHLPDLQIQVILIKATIERPLLILVFLLGNLISWVLSTLEGTFIPFNSPDKLYFQTFQTGPTAASATQ